MVDAAMPPVSQRVQFCLEWLERHGSRRVRDDMVKRYGIVAAKAFGVSVSDIQRLAKEIGKDHALATALWPTAWYEARMLTAFVDDAAQVTPAQMDRWARDFDNWAIVDTLCFHLFDRTAHAWSKVVKWSRARDEFVKRSAFALIAGLSLHDKQAPDARFLRVLPIIERGATDDRHYVAKGVRWALRVLGRRNRSLHTAALDVARRLAESSESSARAIGKESVRDLTRAKLPAR
jgi:3-methyladenine DNA glycosylase AlkD